MAFVVTDYMVKLAKDLVEKKNATESTADTYIRTLVQLNGKKPFKSLMFLKKTDAVIGSLADYALSTRKNMVAAAASVLNLYSQPGYQKTYQFYSDKLKEMHAELAEKRGDTLQKTEKEEKNWVEWDDVEKKRDELKEEVAKFATQKSVTLKQYDTLLAYLILCMYTYVPPRRNQDYQEMWVVRDWKESMPKDRNYLDLHGQQFIFNKYKTAKTSGEQRVEIPDNELRDAIVMYLKHNPHYRASKNKSTEFRFLCKADGTPLTTVNAITRILNKVFGRPVGSSMLRHSYLSKKYGSVMENMREDADMMAHGMDVQKTYIRGGAAAPTLDIIEHA
jgi:integrase